LTQLAPQPPGRRPASREGGNASRRGKAEDLVAALDEKARELGPRPGRKEPAGHVGSAEAGPDAAAHDRRGEPLTGEEDELPPAVVLWRAVDYFDANRERIRYDRWRKMGLPLTSAHVESGIKQTNARVKGSEKAWLLPHAEEMLALRCQAMSQDGRWDRYFDALRKGEIEIPTRGKMKDIPVFGARGGMADKIPA
jgi:hypothetical protein